MRQDYCPIVGAPCQSMCDEPCLSAAKKRIAKLEKDCEILQTNYDAALMQVNQLREALQDFSDYVRNEQMSTDGPVNYSNTQINRLVFKARKALEETK